MLSLLIQQGAQAAQDLEPVSKEKTVSFFKLLFSGGPAGNIIIGILFLMLIIGIYIYFERLFAIKAASKTDAHFMDQIRDNIANGNIEAAKKRCAQENTPVARLTEKGISRIGNPLEDINTAIENAGQVEIYNLEKNTSILATFSGAGPMLGFLGTVVGMVMAFHELATSGGQAQMGTLAEGIYTAMNTTVVGLIVGIVAYVGYNHLVVKTDKVVHQMETTAVEFLDLLNEPA